MVSLLYVMLTVPTRSDPGPSQRGGGHRGRRTDSTGALNTLSHSATRTYCVEHTVIQPHEPTPALNTPSHTATRTYSCAHKHFYTSAYLGYSLHTHTHTHTHTYTKQPHTRTLTHTHTHARTHARTHTRTHTHTQTHTHARTHARTERSWKCSRKCVSGVKRHVNVHTTILLGETISKCS